MTGRSSAECIEAMLRYRQQALALGAVVGDRREKPRKSGDRGA